MQSNHDEVHALNIFLRGEIAAIETYQQAMRNIKSNNAAAHLQQIRDDHRTAANNFRTHVRQHEGDPVQNSGTWGVIAKLVEGTAEIFGTRAALKALKEGEEHGAQGYEDALMHGAIPQECKDLIRSTLVQTHVHVEVLDRLMKMRE